MEIIEVIVNKQIIKTRDKVLVSDSINSYKCKFSFDSSWDNLGKTAVFTNNKVIKEVMISANNECVIPWEVLVDEGFLSIGVYGSTSTSKYPTIWSNKLVIKPGCKEGSSSSPAPTPDIYNQLISTYTQINDNLIDLNQLKLDITDLLLLIEGVYKSGDKNKVEQIENFITNYLNKVTVEELES